MNLGYGFNAQWAFSSHDREVPAPVNPRMLDFMAQYGFNFLRIPIDYRFWMDALKPDGQMRIHDRFLDTVQTYVDAAVDRGIHISINLHRAPGYVITGWETEATNLWSDSVAQVAFETLWTRAAEYFKGQHQQLLSFDLVNEPPDLGQRGFTREIHAEVIRSAHYAIKAVDPTRTIVINGLAGGHLAMPELADLDAVHSGRGYQPMLVSHYKAEWWDGSIGMPVPTYPCDYNGVHWNRDSLWDFYGPWREVQAAGRPIHIGEFGCYRYTDNKVALAWFDDLFEIFKKSNWGYSMWEFEGSFGIANHGRPNTTYETIEGFEIDRHLLELMVNSRV
jgi:hypothetical protein